MKEKSRHGWVITNIRCAQFSNERSKFARFRHHRIQESFQIIPNLHMGSGKTLDMCVSTNFLNWPVTCQHHAWITPRPWIVISKKRNRWYIINYNGSISHLKVSIVIGVVQLRFRVLLCSWIQICKSLKFGPSHIESWIMINLAENPKAMVGRSSTKMLHRYKDMLGALDFLEWASSYVISSVFSPLSRMVTQNSCSPS